MAQSLAALTRHGCERMARYAFDYALGSGRRRVTICHKANILKASSGLFLDTAREVAGEYVGELEVNDVIIDASAMKLALDPSQFDVIVTTNMFGDILCDEIAGVVGGLGLAPGANIGRDVAIFEAVHGSAPDIASRGVANPSARILAACMMLDHVGERGCAQAIRSALRQAIHKDGIRTPDLKGCATTFEFADAVARHLG